MLEQPTAAALVEAFANTVDVEEASDEIATPAALATWLHSRGLRTSRAAVPAGTHASYLALRAGIREQLGAHVGDTPDPGLLAAADRVLADHPVLVTANGSLTAAPGLPPDRHPIAQLAIAWTELTTTGDAIRLKRCAEHACAWVFWDTSKNRSRRWCSMKICGNRNKSRAYAARARAGVGAAGPGAAE
ncbi:CGNR zinc finger domain-containing protein [Streptomyces sp. TRM66268-LWL]|uniref:CGNR zinc finger domain-containing protein n=1 Tax=Streptomyces polyasparticus TaxID=2767826 RepID=A0ABR7S8M7_9ACTN|nr:CGNR zinc finger domain-containing protein [Streptomyces polyasparticus]MBC9711329.1 CGNR zinc finger domain-containing protein [Streptomyces polyasparticus]